MKRCLPVLFIFLLASTISAQSDNSAMCPSISVNGPAGRVSTDGTAIFTADLGNIDDRKLSYEWTISYGEIEKGQGTPSISVHMPTEFLYGTILVTVHLGGLPDGCFSTRVTKLVVDCRSCDPMQFDEYGNIRFADEKMRLDRFAKEVLNANKTTGYIIRSFPKGVSTVMQRRKIREMKAFLFDVRKYPKERFNILLGATGQALTKLYIIPPDPITNKPVKIN